MCAVAMNEPLISISLDHQLLSSFAPSSDDSLSEFDLEQTADLLSVSSQTCMKILRLYCTDYCSVISELLNFGWKADE